MSKEKDRVNIVTVGRLSEEKRFDRLIGSIIQLKDKYSGIHLTIVGEGPKRTELEELISEKGVNESITLIGFDPNPYKYMSDADVYVCSSDFEGFNVAISEAAILNVPVVSTDVTGARELIEVNNEFGFVTNKDVVSLSSGIDYILSSSKTNRQNTVNKKLLSKLAEREVLLNEYF